MTEHQPHPGLHHESDHRVHTTSDQAEEALRQVTLSSRTLRAVTLVTALATLAVVIVFGVLTVSQENDSRARLEAQQANVLAILHVVQGVTDPNTPTYKAQQARSAAAIAEAIHCIENHSDRVSASSRGDPIPLLAAGCPPDSLGST